MPFRTPFLLAAWAGLAICAPQAEAASLIYDADTGTPLAQDGAGAGWNTTNANWWNGVSDTTWPDTSADEAIFGTLSGAAGAVAVGTVTTNKITFNAPGSGNYTLSGGAVTLAGATPTITANVNGTIGSVLAGSAGLTKAGAGTLTLTGGIANTYTGTTSVQQGTLVLSKTAGTTVVAGSIVMPNASSPTLYMTADNQLGGTGTLTFQGNSGNARFDLFGTSQTLAGLVENDGGRGGVVQNSEAVNGAPSTTATGTLNLTGAGSYAYNGYLRNQTGALTVDRRRMLTTLQQAIRILEREKPARLARKAPAVRFAPSGMPSWEEDNRLVHLDQAKKAIIRGEILKMMAQLEASPMKLEEIVRRVRPALPFRCGKSHVPSAVMALVRTGELIRMGTRRQMVYVHVSKSKDRAVENEK